MCIRDRSFVAALVVWYILSILPSTSRAFPFAPATINGLITMVERGVFWDDLSSSLISVALGYGLGFVIALPVAILMAWYLPVRNIINPWIQFIRNIPPLAYVPLLVACAGIGRPAQVTTITIACFLIMCVTIYQGVINVDETLIKAARVLGAKNRDIFVRVLAPATLPFILTAIRLGASVALTTIIAEMCIRDRFLMPCTKTLAPVRAMSNLRSRPGSSRFVDMVSSVYLSSMPMPRSPPRTFITTRAIYPGRPGISSM